MARLSGVDGQEDVVHGFGVREISSGLSLALDLIYAPKGKRPAERPNPEDDDANLTRIRQKPRRRVETGEAPLVLLRQPGAAEGRSEP